MKNRAWTSTEYNSAVAWLANVDNNGGLSHSALGIKEYEYGAFKGREYSLPLLFLI